MQSSHETLARVDTLLDPATIALHDLGRASIMTTMLAENDAKLRALISAAAKKPRDLAPARSTQQTMDLLQGQVLQATHAHAPGRAVRHAQLAAAPESIAIRRSQFAERAPLPGPGESR